MHQNKKETGKHARIDGYKAENFAALFLKLKGYKILERNFKPPKGTGAGEIDIIAEKHNTIIFIEVKKRKSLSSAAEAVNEQVQSRRIKGAQYFLMTHPALINKEMRFDVILLSSGHFPEHIKNAFTES